MDESRSGFSTVRGGAINTIASAAQKRPSRPRCQSEAGSSGERIGETTMPVNADGRSMRGGLQRLADVRREIGLQLLQRVEMDVHHVARLVVRELDVAAHRRVEVHV